MDIGDERSQMSLILRPEITLVKSNNRGPTRSSAVLEVLPGTSAEGDRRGQTPGGSALRHAVIVDG